MPGSRPLADNDNERNTYWYFAGENGFGDDEAISEIWRNQIEKLYYDKKNKKQEKNNN